MKLNDEMKRIAKSNLDNGWTLFDGERCRADYLAPEEKLC